MEIADLFVINKADHPGADRVEQEILSMLGITPRQDAWRPPVLRTVATTGAGAAELRQKLDEFRSFGEKGILTARRREQCRARLLALLRQELFERVASDRLGDGALANGVEEVFSRKRDPHSVVEKWVAESTAGKPQTIRSRS